ncbi:MAG TPA: cytochrome c [Rhodopila sp.]|nr:cytochrome c [Rhodopila sp.]
MRPDRLALVAAFLLLAAPAFAQSPKYHLGRSPTAAEISAWNIDVLPDGRGLPPGHGSVAEGRAVFADNCAACHGDKGQNGAADRLVGGIGTLSQHNPVRTVGSYWPYATTLFDFIHRAMPFTAPESLSPDQVYAVVAYLLSLNGIVPDNAVLDANSLPKVVMPNRNGFVAANPKPDLP